MNLRALSAHFVRHEMRMCDGKNCGIVHTEPKEHENIITVDTLAEADGLWFLCPKCFSNNGGPRGTHAVLCWFEGKVSDDIDPKPGRWKPQGTGIDDISFVPGRFSNSVLLEGGGCQWHGFVTNGDAT